ncbi:YncE family protein [Hymenobacter humi]|uniref:YncE family protein n=1 Tax=Hymenobacter humi TaxID=1411620 RepID=A0ABW2UD40_9BACT
MNNARLEFFVGAGTLLLLAGACHSDNKAQQAAALSPRAAPLLTLERTVPLPHVKGGFDLMALDVAGQRLFVAAEDHHTVEVIDVRRGQPLASLPGFNEPKWVVYRPEGNRLFVSTGGDGRVTELDGTTYQKVRSYAFREACNNLRYDSLTRQLVVGVGKSFGALGLIDVARNVKVGEIPLAGYAKQFELDGPLIYVNEPALNQVEVIDRSTGKQTAVWPVTGATQNIPMALDRGHHRLFVACAPGRWWCIQPRTGGAWPACPSRPKPTASTTTPAGPGSTSPAAPAASPWCSSRPPTATRCCSCCPRCRGRAPRCTRRPWTRTFWPPRKGLERWLPPSLPRSEVAGTASRVGRGAGIPA